MRPRKDFTYKNFQAFKVFALAHSCSRTKQTWNTNDVHVVKALHDQARRRRVHFEFHGLFTIRMTVAAMPLLDAFDARAKYSACRCDNRY